MVSLCVIDIGIVPTTMLIGKIKFLQNGPAQSTNYTGSHTWIIYDGIRI